MWFPASTDMSLNGGASAFLLQTWQELFDPFTPDSYQPRLHHTASLVSELGEVAEWAFADARWNKDVALVKAELKRVANGEIHFLEGLPRYKWSIAKLLTLDNPTDIISLSRTLQSERASYDLHAAEALCETVSRLPKSKHDARIALYRIATNFVQSGRVASQAHAVASHGNLLKTPGELADMILSTLSESTGEYRSILAVRGKLSAVQSIARKVGFRLLSSDDLRLSGEVKDQFLAFPS
jgi:hypothetical protein